MATVTVSPAAGSQGAEARKRRYGVAASAAVNTVLASCDVIDIRDYGDIAVKPSAGITSLTVHASETEGGTYVVVTTIGTAGAVTVVASVWNVLDVTKIAPFGFIKLVPNTNGTVAVVGKT